MGLTSLMSDLDDWCGTPVPGRPPRPPWLRDILTAVVVAELSGRMDDSDVRRDLYQVAARMYESAAAKVALNPQPLPPIEALNPQPLPPFEEVGLNPQPLPPIEEPALNPQPLPPIEEPGI
jgi:hypothetical protein